MRSLTINLLTAATLTCITLPVAAQSVVPAQETKPNRKTIPPSYKPAPVRPSEPSNASQPVPTPLPQNVAPAPSSGTQITGVAVPQQSIPVRPRHTGNHNGILAVPAQQQPGTPRSATEQVLQLMLDTHLARPPRDLPPIENGKLHAFRLKHINPQLLAETLESFLGTNQLRLVPDVDNNVLLTYSTLAVSEQIAELVEVLDAEKENGDLNLTFENKNEKTQSLQVRIFWLADAVGDQIALDYLPEAVLDAIRRLGLRNPRLVSQSATTVAGIQNERSAFQFRFPAIIGNQSVLFESGGDLAFGIQPQLDLHVSIRSHQPIELAGELSAPLGHYMVLGTTNYNASTPSSVFSNRGSGRRANDEPPREASAETVEATEPTTSRFAFVVQVVEAESFAPPEEDRLGIISESDNR